MNLEEKTFDKYEPDFNRLLDYGFIKDKDDYVFQKDFGSSLEAFVMVKPNGKIIGRVMDRELDEEYISFRLPSQIGEYAAKVKEEYVAILEDIRDNCFVKRPFHSAQANRIAERIKLQYGVLPEFLWEKFPGYGVFRNVNSTKWFGLISLIDRGKLIKKAKGTVEVLNVRTGNETEKYLHEEGIYPAFHMNKKNWVSIILDDTLTDDEIMKLVERSMGTPSVHGEWLVPANPKYYDVVNAFNDTDTIIWKQSSKIQVGDIVYLYVADPYSCIMFRCEAVETDIPYEYKGKDVSMTRVMRIKLLRRYEPDEFTFSKLGEYGIRAIRGPRGIPEKLSEDLKRSS